MKISLPSIKRPREDADVADAPPNATAEQMVEADIAGKAIAVALGLCLLAGPAALVLSATGTEPQPVAETVQVDDNAGAAQLEAAEFAVRLVETWLASTTNDADALDQLVSTSALSPGKEPITITGARAASIERAGKAWSVTVAGTIDNQRRYFQVPVSIADGTVAGLSLPTPVSAPSIVSTAGTDYGRSVTPSSPLQQTVADFLTAYLAGGGDVSRYVSPGEEILAVDPALATAVQIEDLRSTDDDVALEAAPTEGETVRVLALVALTISDEQAINATYALTMTARAGRWEITQVDPAPAWTDNPPNPDDSSSDPAEPTPATP